MKSSSSDAARATLSRELFEEVCESFDDGRPLCGIDYLQDHAISWLWDPAERIGRNFNERRDLFLWLLNRLLLEGRIKLHAKGNFFDASVDEQVDRFRQAFPQSEEGADRICTMPGHVAPYEGFGMNVWWFLDVCPAGVAWLQADGGYQIAD